MKGWTQSMLARAVVWSAGLAVCTAQAMPAQQSGASAGTTRTTGTTAATARQVARDSVVADSLARVFRAVDERNTLHRLMTLRTEYLHSASWADLGERCNPGALRIFANDTTTAQRDWTQKIALHMEQIVIGRGVGARLDTPEAAALIRTIVGWEAGIDRPVWDANDTKTRVAFAAGLTGEVPDPSGPGCLPSAMASDTVTFVLPGFSAMQFPGAPKPRVKAYFGPDARQHARDQYYTSYGSKNPDAVFSYWLVAPVVIWKEWALVGVDRPKERGGIEVGSPGNGGAVYLMRRVDKQWRLLSVVRAWGS